MPAMTSDDLFQLSKAFHTMSMAIGNYRYNNAKNLSAADSSSLESKQWTLFNTSSDLNADSALLAMQLDAGNLQTLKDTTTAMNAVAAKITDVKKAIAIATQAVAFGGALYLAATSATVATINGVISAANSLVGAINA